MSEFKQNTFVDDGQPLSSPCVYSPLKSAKPTVIVVDAADDTVLLKVTVHRHNRNTAGFTLEETLREIKTGIKYMFRDVRVETEILSSDRIVLRSHEESSEDE